MSNCAYSTCGEKGCTHCYPVQKMDKTPLEQQLYEALKAIFDDNCFYHKSGDERAYRLATEAIRKAEGK